MEDNNNKKNSFNVPDELILDILLCLPIKSLMRFRCVNKTWLQLLTNDPQFAQLYLNKSNKNKPTILALRREHHLEHLQDKKATSFYSAVELRLEREILAVPLELPFCECGSGTQHSSSYYVCGIRNGLVLVCLADKLFIWNPFTNDYIDIPCPPTPTHSSECCDGITNFGFGFLQDTNQYKVIRFCDCDYHSFDKMSHVSVYTLGIDSSWRNLKDISYYSISPDCTAPLVNGVLHWNANIGQSSSFDDFFYNVPKSIVSFDMKDENFGEIPHPKHANVNYPVSYYDKIGELDGLLCMLGRDCGENIQVWVMQEYGVASSWTKQFTIGRPDICKSFTSLRPICVPQKDEILPKTNIQIETSTDEVILYNPGTNTVTNLEEFGLHLYAAYSYTPSLISPRVISGAVRCTSLISPGAINEVDGRKLAIRRRQAYSKACNAVRPRKICKKIVTPRLRLCMQDIMIVSITA